MPSDSELLATAYLTLVGCALPGDPKQIARGALDAAALSTELPPGFGADPSADAAWLAGELGAVTPPWPILQAMAWAAGILHTVLATPAMGPALGAMRKGTAPAPPGFLLHGLPDGRFVISDVAPGCSAAVSGLRVGDVVLRLGGQPMTRPVPTLIQLHVSPPGTELLVEVVRDGARMEITLRLTPARLPLVESRALSATVGYIFVRSITASEEPDCDAGTLVQRAAAELAAGGARSFVLDVRSNPGGDGAGAARIASLFADGDPMLLFRRPDGSEVSTPRFGAKASYPWPVVVLVDDQSASAAEMLAVALRDHAGSPIVGQDTAGALTAGMPRPLRDGYALMTPGALSVGPRTRATFAGARIAVDVRVPNRSPEDLVAGKDAQLDAALALLAKG